MPEENITAVIEQRIVAFKHALGQAANVALEEHVLRHDCSVVGVDVEQGLRAAIAEQFGAEANDVYVVGSAKLGFSPKPGQYFKHFSDQSDIDIAVVSSGLYTRIWHEVNQMSLAGEFFNREKFAHYHTMGWIRPDVLPTRGEYERCYQWWKFFKHLSSREEFLRMKISGGLYYDLQFLRQYQLGGLTVLREQVVSGAA
jgi:hypothetical protein